MVIKPPGNLWRSRVLKVDNRIFIAREVSLMEQSACAVHQPAEFILCAFRNALAMKAAEERSRTSSIKTFVVIENANFQCWPLLSVLSAALEFFRISRAARHVKAAAFCSACVVPSKRNRFS